MDQPLTERQLVASPCAVQILLSLFSKVSCLMCGFCKCLLFFNSLLIGVSCFQTRVDRRITLCEPAKANGKTLAPFAYIKGPPNLLSEGHISYYTTVRGPDILRNVVVSEYVTFYQINKRFVNNPFFHYWHVFAAGWNNFAGQIWCARRCLENPGVQHARGLLNASKVWFAYSTSATKYRKQQSKVPLISANQGSAESFAPYCATQCRLTIALQSV